MSIAGQFLGGILKKKVKTPEFLPISPQQEQQEAIAGNLASLPGATQLGAGINDFQQSQILGQVGAVTPGLEGLLGKNASNIDALLRGELSETDQASLIRNRAAVAGEGGYLGAPKQGAETLRDLGISQLQAKTQGAEQLNRWLGTSRAALTSTQYDPASMFIDPRFQTEQQGLERTLKFQRDFGSNQLKAAQHWQTILGNAVQDTDNQITQTAFSALGDAAGSGGGGL